MENKTQGEAGRERRATPSAESQATGELNAAHGTPWTMLAVPYHPGHFTIYDSRKLVVADVYIGTDYANLLFAAPVLYEALKATPCRYSRRQECSSSIVDMCDRCAALELAGETDQQNSV